jgi:hypothetical protein
LWSFKRAAQWAPLFHVQNLLLADHFQASAPVKINFADLALLRWLVPIKASCHILKYLMLRMLFIGDDEDAIQTRFVKWLAQHGYYSQTAHSGFTR